MTKPLLDIRDLSKALKIPEKTIRNKLSDGTWPIAPLRIGKALRWRPDKVDLYIESQESGDQAA